MTTEHEPTSADETDTSQLERSQDAINEARDAVQEVARTDSIDEQATGAGDLPAFAESAEGTHQPEPPTDDVDDASEEA